MSQKRQRTGVYFDKTNNRLVYRKTQPGTSKRLKWLFITKEDAEAMVYDYQHDIKWLTATEQGGGAAPESEVMQLRRENKKLKRQTKQLEIQSRALDKLKNK